MRGCCPFFIIFVEYYLECKRFQCLKDICPLGLCVLLLPQTRWAFFMAENKKSFLLYCDQQGIFNQLPDEIAGRLIKHIFAYVNDEEPVTDELIVNIAFEPIKQQLKRDLVKYNQFVDKQRDNGLKGGRPKKPNETQKTQAFTEEPKKADNVNVNVTDNVNVNEIDIKRDKSLVVDGNEIFYEDAFNQVWKAYNYSSTRQAGSKAKALAKWMKLSNDDILAIRTHLPKFIKAHVEAKKTEFFPDFTTYLNGRRFEDEKMPYATNQAKGDDFLNKFV